MIPALRTTACTAALGRERQRGEVRANPVPCGPARCATTCVPGRATKHREVAQTRDHVQYEKPSQQREETPGAHGSLILVIPASRSDRAERTTGGDPSKRQWGTKSPLSSSQSFISNGWLGWIPAALPCIFDARRGDDVAERIAQARVTCTRKTKKRRRCHPGRRDVANAASWRAGNQSFPSRLATLVPRAGRKTRLGPGSRKRARPG